MTGYIRAAWAHCLRNDATVNGACLALPNSGFAIEGSRAARNAALVSGGLDLHLTPSVTIGARVDGEIARNANRTGGTAQISVRF